MATLQQAFMNALKKATQGEWQKYADENPIEWLLGISEDIQEQVTDLSNAPKWVINVGNTPETHKIIAELRSKVDPLFRVITSAKAEKRATE
jgi:hypothetical protein